MNNVNDEKILCTVAILTKNSSGTLRRALDTVRDFAEILVCDGGSTDSTLEIAREYGARVIEQDKKYLDESGRISNFGEIRNQTLAAATYDWFLFVDSDEYLGFELVEEIRKIVKEGMPGVYWIPRRYVFDDTVIECATSYPSYQPRFFHKGAVSGFVKEVHERINPKSGANPVYLKEYMYVPIGDDVQATRAKWRAYLALEYARRYPYSFYGWMRHAARELAIGVLYTLRLVRVWLFCRGTKLPVRMELLRPWYQLALIWTTLKSVRRW